MVVFSTPVNEPVPEVAVLDITVPDTAVDVVPVVDVPEVTVADVTVLEPAGVSVALYVVVLMTGVTSLSSFFVQALNNKVSMSAVTQKDKKAFIIF